MIQPRGFNNPSHAILLTAIVVQVLCTAEHASATLLAHESFGYGTDITLIGQSGGTGFSSAWQSGPANIAGGGTTGGLSADNISLSYPLGSKLTANGARFQTLPATDDNDFIRLLSTPIDLSVDGTYYFSYLGQKSDQATGSDFMIIGLNSDATLDPSSGDLDARAAEIGWGSGDNILMAVNPASAYSSTSLPGKQIDKDLLMILKIVSRAVGNDDVFGYVYSGAMGDVFPDIVGGEPGDGEWLLTRTMDSSEILDRVRIISGSNVAGQVDEVRLGTTWADVTAVPEPAGLSLILLGSLAIFGLRKVTP